MTQKLQERLSLVKPLDKGAMQAAQARLDDLTKPRGSLGVMESIARRIAGIKGVAMPSIKKKTCILMAGDHGVTEEGVSAYPQEVTRQMVLNFLNGGAAMNVFSRQVDAELVVVDIGVAADFDDHPLLVKEKVSYGTANMAKGPAMNKEATLTAVERGMKVASACIDRGSDLIGIGEMGIGNTTPSTALLVLFTGIETEKAAGKGTGIEGDGLKKKVAAVEKALQVNEPDPADPVQGLAAVGGLEIAGLVGVIVECAARRVPVVVDGFISGAAALTASRLNPYIKDYLLASHLSEEPGHRYMLEAIGVEPVLFMNMRLGEGTGAALAMPVIEASLKVMHEMASFSSAGVSTSSPVEQGKNA